MTTTNKVSAAIEVIKVVAETIREVGSIPSGHLYAKLMGHMDLDQYQSMIRILKNTGLVSESNHLLTWTGPQV